MEELADTMINDLFINTKHALRLTEGDTVWIDVDEYNVESWIFGASVSQLPLF